MVLLLLLLSLSFAQVKVLSTERNEGSFAIGSLEDGVCFVGREDRGENNYDALVGVCSDKCKVYSVGSRKDDYSYTVVSFGRACLAGLVTFGRGNMDIALVEFGPNGVRVRSTLGRKADEMLWYMTEVKNGFALVGGVFERNWDILIIRLSRDLKVLWSKRIGTEKDEYAYGVVQKGDKYYVAGRSNFRGNWDGFLLVLSEQGDLLSSSLYGSPKKDYFRYVGLYKGHILAVGRTEERDDSDVLLILPEEGRYYAYDGGDFDYGRVFRETRDGLVLMGDTYKSGDSDGLLLYLNGDFEVKGAYTLGGEGIESVRFLDGSLNFAGYTYSFTLDNDIMIGRLPPKCLVRRKEVIPVRVKIERFPYPVKEEDYPLESPLLNFKVRKVEIREIDPCGLAVD